MTVDLRRICVMKSSFLYISAVSRYIVHLSFDIVGDHVHPNSPSNLLKGVDELQS